MAGACPNLLAEAQLYRYDPETPNAESPLKEHDHALDALRYLISKLDWKKMARMRRGQALEDAPPPGAPDGTGGTPAAAQPKPRKWLSIYNEALWTRIG